MKCKNKECNNEFIPDKSHTYQRFCSGKCRMKIYRLRPDVRKKKELYDKNKLKLISIFPKDDIHQKLSFLIPLFSKIQKPLFEYIK